MSTATYYHTVIQRRRKAKHVEDADSLGQQELTKENEMPTKVDALIEAALNEGSSDMWKKTFIELAKQAGAKNPQQLAKEYEAYLRKEPIADMVNNYMNMRALFAKKNLAYEIESYIIPTFED